MAATNGRLERALRGVERQYDEFKRTLIELARIPSVSAPGFPPAEVRRSAEAFADLLRRTLRTAGSVPCNVKFLIEGEEEIGSGNLGKFLERYRGMMSADAVVLSDTSNFDTGIPALTYRLRGLCQVDFEVRCLERPVHSGQKGGPVRKGTPRQRARIRRLPFDARMRALPSTRPGGP